MQNKNLHLAVSACIIFQVAIIYGLAPTGMLSDIFQFKIDTVNLSGIFRALMGLYVGMVVFWLIGIMKPHFWIAATLSNILFMSGLATGRVISLIADGVPSPVFLLGLAVEILLATWGVVNLKNIKHT